MAEDWLKSSIMAKRGRRQGRGWRAPQLTIEQQGSFHYVYGPYAKPTLSIDPGDVVVGRDRRRVRRRAHERERQPDGEAELSLPQSAMRSDRGQGRQEGRLPRGPYPSTSRRAASSRPATTCIIPEFGGLVGTSSTAMLNPPLPERVRKLHVDRNGVRWSDKITLPYEPFIGTIGVSPEIEAISSLQPDYHGGNMDLPDVAPGAILYFPVHTEGGLLYVGDCHATQGDGELSGVALEQRATVTLQVDLIKNWSFAWPRLETRDFIMTIGSARPLEDAARIAYRELMRWMSADYGFDEIDAYMLLSQAGRMRLGNMVDPKYTMGASILKNYLKA